MSSSRSGTFYDYCYWNNLFNASPMCPSNALYSNEMHLQLASQLLPSSPNMLLDEFADDNEDLKVSTETMSSNMTNTRTSLFDYTLV